jgi:transposase, IS6 family
MADIVTSATTATFQRRVLFPGASSHLPELRLTRLTRVHVIHPSGLPLACNQWMEHRSLGFLPGFTPRRYRRRMPGAETSVEHSLVVNRRSLNPPFRLSHSTSATSRRTTIYRWVQRFTPLLIDAARPCRHAPGERWFVDETYVRIAGRWRYVYRAIDQFGQVIDVLVSEKRDLAATRRFFTRALEHGPSPTEVTTDRAAAYPRVLDELVPAACHVTEHYANNPIEADHGRLKSRLRPMRGLKQLRCARVISAGHAFVQNLRRDHYELGTEEPTTLRVMVAFTELTVAI